MSVKTLLISTGIPLEPVIFTINRLKPEDLCFFVSEDAKRRVDMEIIPKIEQPPKRWDQIVTSDPEDLLACCRILIKDLPGLLSRWDVEPSQLTVDYTSGTKTMSVALALYTINASSGYYSVGDKEQAKGGQGVVMNGQERAVYQTRPWDELAVKERREAAMIFNRACYRQAGELFQKIEKRVSGSSKPLYKALADLSEGYALWDRFDYRVGWNKLQTAKKALEMAALFGGPASIKTLLTKLTENLAFLEKIVMGAREIKPELFLDLLANAQRRARLEQYEDATARLYRSLETLAQVRLSERHLNTAQIDPERLPTALKQEFVMKYTSVLDGKIKIGLEPSMHLLRVLGDELGEAFHGHWSHLKVVMEARNSAVLAHGFALIKPEWYQQLWETVLRLSGIPLERVPQFPKMEL